MPSNIYFWLKMDTQERKELFCKLLWPDKLHEILLKFSGGERWARTPCWVSSNFSRRRGLDSLSQCLPVKSAQIAAFLGWVSCTRSSWPQGLWCSDHHTDVGHHFFSAWFCHCMVGKGLCCVNQSITAPSLLQLWLRWVERGAWHPPVWSSSGQDVQSNCDIQQGFWLGQEPPDWLGTLSISCWAGIVFICDFGAWHNILEPGCLNFASGSDFCYKPGCKCWATIVLAESQVVLLGTSMWQGYKHLSHE